MSILGYYYLHTNHSLIWKKSMDGDEVADFRESPFVVQFWPLDPQDRSTAWRILVEALALGADEQRIEELADLWACDDIDAQRYAEHIGVELKPDGSAWCAMQIGATNIQEFSAGFSEKSALHALAELCRDLGYQAQKTWGATFSDLVNAVPPVQQHIGR